ncbi:MAG: 1-(5-phosphoribosyl)-5-[(5-phosphoribosylamino)methylideneamino]imidazole-4-carboxamide isomerase [Aquificae bacterium]|nr:1-(5-phosphoribosyl)-5-[(5-phosphoribosylamino)methylideneamino]imidazole-4-carboxamide isomerase [Aquificota bacterium]
MDLKGFVIPAVDLKGGKVVRLYRGDYSKETVYSVDPVEVAKRFCDLGFRRLHLVDLDGAKEGLPANLRVVEKIRNAVDCELQFGGGVRTEEAARKLLEEVGVDYLVVGTLALKNPTLFEELVLRYPKRFVLSVDAKGGKVAVGGWLESSALTPEELASRYEDKPIWGYLYTVVERDGTLSGVDPEPYRRFKRVVSKPVLASGGVATLEDLKKLHGLVEGVVVGRALYEGTIRPEDL